MLGTINPKKYGDRIYATLVHAITKKGIPKERLYLAYIPETEELVILDREAEDQMIQNMSNEVLRFDRKKPRREIRQDIIDKCTEYTNKAAGF